MIWPIFFPPEYHPFNVWNYLKAVLFQIYAIFLLCVCSPTHLYLLSLLSFPLLWLSCGNSWVFPWFCVVSVLPSSFLCRFLYPILPPRSPRPLWHTWALMSGQVWRGIFGWEELSPPQSEVSGPHCGKLNPFRQPESPSAPKISKKVRWQIHRSNLNIVFLAQCFSLTMQSFKWMNEN